ncbi:hypothetical protein N7457_005378 [Penicillium paradoxum]|uniref:uncharacterized protein n=1 Tax=Penicillium paradoxum TaxID=176176 RepID=UPI00254724D2|nr:uncharacterized protein N7457_005378 [Penicillium paradoxum]KAJ5780218.1 hypothetical protein N7457_005378 [Penicillium paradoxum]
MKRLPQISGRTRAGSSIDKATSNKNLPSETQHCHHDQETVTAYRWAGSRYTDAKADPIIRDYLREGSDTSLSTVVESITSLLPKEAPLSDDVAVFGELIFELSKELPYQGSSHARLVQLLVALALEPLEEDPCAYVNCHAFLARLFEARIFQPDANFAVWTMRDSLEKDLSKIDIQIRSAWILAAAQWILWQGRTMFNQIAPSVISRTKPIYSSMWAGGPLYHGDSTLSMQRWRFWKESFRKISEGSDVTDECKDAAAQSVKLMDAYESVLRF